MIEIRRSASSACRTARACRCRPTRPPAPPASICRRRAAEDAADARARRPRAVPTGFAIAMPAGLRGAGAAALGPGAASTASPAQHARHDRRRLPRRDAGDPGQPRREPFVIARGERIAQLVVAPVVARGLRGRTPRRNGARRRRLRLDGKGDRRGRIAAAKRTFRGKAGRPSWAKFRYLPFRLWSVLGCLNQMLGGKF